MRPALWSAPMQTTRGLVHPTGPLDPGRGTQARTRWRWIAHDPISQTQPPAPTRPDPHPPTAKEAARILVEAASDPARATFVRLAMTTGARRGELCGLRWRNVDLDSGTIILRTSIAQDGARGWEKDTKTHQQRRVEIDPTPLRCRECTWHGVRNGQRRSTWRLDPNRDCAGAVGSEANLVPPQGSSISAGRVHGWRRAVASRGSAGLARYGPDAQE